MSMAQWTLGSAIAVALALGAFAWRTNKANYERDREAIQREAKALATELRSELRTEFQSESAKALEALSSKERTIQESIERTLTKQIAALTSKIKDVENGALDLRESALEREADEAVKSGNFRWAARQYCELLELHVRRDMDEYFASVVLDKLRDIAKRPDALLDTEAVTRIVKTLKDLPERHHAACEPLVELLKKKLA